MAIASHCCMCHCDGHPPAVGPWAQLMQPQRHNGPCLKYVVCYGNVVAAGIHQQGDEINDLKAACLLTCHSTGVLSLSSPVQVMQDSSMTHFTALCLAISGEVMVARIL